MNLNKRNDNLKFYFHTDGVLMFAAGLVLYIHLGYSGVLFAAFILAPDLFMLGYLFGKKAGALIYNIGHMLLWPAVLSLSGLVLSRDLLIALGLIWLCHIGMDHIFGYGFKYQDGFKHTHFSEL